MGSKRLAELPDAYLELHIEQGPVLALAGEPLGVVTAIAGAARGAKVFSGRADHAGTTPMDARSDALVDAAHFILHVRECAKDGAVATVGVVEVEPNAINVVPERVTVSVDARSADSAQLAALVEAIGFEPSHRLEPALLERRVRRRAAGRAAPRLGGGARRDGARARRRPELDAVRPVAERRRQPPSGRALERRGHRTRRRRSHGRTE